MSTSTRTARLRILVSATASRTVQRLSARITAIRLTRVKADDVQLPARNRPIELVAGSAIPVGFTVTVPAGHLLGLVLELRQLRASSASTHLQKYPADGPFRRVLAERVNWTLPLDLVIEPDTETSAAFEIDTELVLANPQRSAGAVRRRPHNVGLSLERIDDARGGVRFVTRDAAGPGSPTPSFELVAPPGVFDADVTIAAEIADRGALPPLFKRQRAVGPIVRVRANQPPRGPIEISVAFDEAAMMAAGLSLDRLVVLQLDEDRRRYRELAPIRIDVVHHTLTVQTDSLSFFFAGTPGFEITYPAFHRNAAEEVAAISRLPETLVAGRAFDERAVVTCHEAPRGWTRLGLFVFEGIALGGPAERTVHLTATVEGLIAHELALTIRRPPPTKRITEPARIYGSSCSVSRGNVPFATAFIYQDGFREDQTALIEEFRGWQLAFRRAAPYAYWFDADATAWRYIRLLPDAYMENVVAAVLIAAAPQTIGRAIPIDPAHPEEVRALLSLRDFYRPIFARHDLASLIVALGLRPAFDEASRPFAAGQITFSPSAPLLTGSDDELETALAGVTAAGSQRAAANPMRTVMRDMLGPQRTDEAARPAVHAGRLLYVRARRDGAVSREIAAEDIWCATVALKRHPLTGHTFLLAIGLADAEAEEPRSALLLIERRGANDFVSQTISRDFPIFDADLAFMPDGTPVAVASYIGSRLDKPHLLMFSRPAEGWSPSAIHWHAAFQQEATDIGAFPRIVVDPAGRITVAFISPILNRRFGQLDLGSSYRWLIAKPDADGWQAAGVGSASVRSLTGDTGHRNDGEFAPGILGQSARGVAAFTPALALRTDGRIAYALGTGALLLATVDRETLTVDVRSIDIDRRTGFAPALALNRNDVPAVTYQDDFGGGDTALAASAGLHFFSLAAGNVVPNRNGDVPLSPSHGSFSVFIGGFAPYVPITCRTLRDTARLQDLLDSILMHRRFHVETAVGEPRQFWGVHWAYYDSHRELNQMIDGLPQRPRILQFTIDNSPNAQAEGIERVFLTIIDPLARVPGDFRATLDGGSFPDELRRILVEERGFRMSRPIDIGVERVLSPGENRVDPGRAWRIRDLNPFNADRLTLPDPALNSTTREPVSVTYDLRLLDDGQYEIHVPPLLTVHDAPRFVDADGHYAPCRMAQARWDVAAGFVAPMLQAAIPPINFGDQVDVRRASLRGAQISRVRPQAFGGHQQNEIRFVLVIDFVHIRGIDPEHGGAAFEAYTTEPSEFHVPFAPFVTPAGEVAWWARAVQARLGALQVDVLDWGDLDFLRFLLPFIPLLGGLAVVIADAVIDDIATDRASEQVRPPGIGGLPALLLQRYAAYVTAQLPRMPSAEADTPGRPVRVEAVYADGFYLTLWNRHDLVEQLPTTAVGAVPAIINFGNVRLATAPPPRRNMLVSCDGGLAIVLEAIEFEPDSGELRITGPMVLPQVLAPGDSVVVGIEFTPQAPLGDRRVTVRVRFNTTASVTTSVLGHVIPPPHPVARVEPELLNFGVVTAGQQQLRIARVFNVGDGDLDVTAFEIQADPNAAGVFTTPAAPIKLALGIGISAAITYAPPAGPALTHRGRLRVHSTDPDHPVQEVGLFGQSAAGALMVLPAALDMGASALLPDLPYGIGRLRNVDVYNTGTAAITITAPSFRIVDALGGASPHYLLADQGIVVTPAGPQPPPPIAQADRIIAAGASFPVTIMFAPTAEGVYPARLVLTPGNAAVPSVTVEIAGRSI